MSKGHPELILYHGKVTTLDKKNQKYRPLLYQMG